MVVRRFEVYLVNLDPTLGSEIQKTRPCLVISPDEMNELIATVIIAPMTTKGRKYPTRVDCLFEGKEGQIVLDQIRTVDKVRDEFEVDWKLVRAISHIVSPLAFPPLVPRERRFIYAVIADRVVKPEHPRALWRHWEEPEIHWFSGGHVLGIWNGTIGDFLARALETSGMRGRSSRR